MFELGDQMAGFVAYLRVSTRDQGRSGLGLAAQKAAIERFLGAEHRLIAEFVEIQSGRKDNRVELKKAISLARREKASLLIARLDRFSRRVSFIAGVVDQGVHLTVAELPNATDFQLHIFAALAQEERRVISQRTKAALVEAKRRGVKLGASASRLSERNRSEADSFALGLIPVLRRTAGMTLAETARALNHAGHTSRRGGRFHPQTVKNIRARIHALGALGDVDC